MKYPLCSAIEFRGNMRVGPHSMVFDDSECDDFITLLDGVVIVEDFGPLKKGSRYKQLYINHTREYVVAADKTDKIVLEASVAGLGLKR